MIAYPRKCNTCDHVANNPASWHYHKHIHEAIPTGQLCDFDCGQLATYKRTSGKYCCSETTHRCAGYLQRHADTVRRQWATNEWADRREQNRARTARETPEQRRARNDKQSATMRAKSGTITPESAKDYRHYARGIRRRAQSWARKQGHTIGRSTFHVDHKLSINDAWKAGLPEPIVNHPVNLRILESRANSGKGPHSILTVGELLALIEQYDEL